MKQRISRTHSNFVLGLMVFTLSAGVLADPDQHQVDGQSAVFSDDLANTSRWQPHIDAEAKPGNRRDLGEVGLFVPIAQDPRRLLFADLRARFDGDGSQEGNFGLVYRQMLESGWNLGAYGYFDRRRTGNDNFFNQLTLGAEALSLNWDLRANRYIQVGERRRSVDKFNTAHIEGTSIFLRQGQERSMSGYDGEIGWRVPVSDADDNFQFRVFAGGYHFTAASVPTVAGPRGRIEAVFNEVPMLWRGSRLSLGVEVQRDRPRGRQAFASLRLRIPLPLGSGPATSGSHHGMARRMTDPVVRDVDVVTQTGDFGPTEQVTQTASGQALTVLEGGATANLPAAVAAAGANSTVILTGSFNTGTARTMLQAGQTVMGAGTLEVRSPSGRTAALSTPGATITAAPNAGLSTFLMNHDSTLRGLTINTTSTAGTATAVQGVNVSNATIANNTITANGPGAGSTAVGVSILGSASGILVENNTITAIATGGGGTATALTISSSGATVRNNSLSANGDTARYVFITGNVALGEGSTGNRAGNGICSISGTASGTGNIQFSNAANCGP